MARTDDSADPVSRAFATFTTPPRCTASARELRVIERARSVRLERTGPWLDPSCTTVATYSWGAGPLVVLLHGWGGRAAQLASFVEPIVGQGFRVVAADAPAHGSSPGARASIEEFAALLTLLADRFGPIHGAVGHSLGGAAILLALTRGVRAERAALIAPTARLLDELLKFTAVAELSDAVAKEVRDHAQSQLGADIWERTTLVDLAPRVGVETLVVHDEHDPDVSFSASVSLTAALPNGALYATRGLGHLAILRTREVVQRVVAHVTASPSRA